MTIRLAPPGIWLDETPVACTYRLNFGGGRARLDRQDEQAEEDPTSKVTWRFSGWEERDLLLTLEISPALRKPAGDPERFSHAGVIFAAQRSTGTDNEGKPVPEQHELIGALPRAMGIDKVLIEHIDAEETTDHDELIVKVYLLEFDPERVTLRYGPTPPDHTDDLNLPGEYNPLTDAELHALTSLEASLPEAP